MLRVTEEQLEYLDRRRPGVRQLVMQFENADLPPCPRCGSADTARVQVGVVGVTISIACATTKIKLLANGGDARGSYWCNACERFLFGTEAD